MGIILYSFDIFDTLITRRTAVPKGIFDIMEENIKNYNKDNIGSLPENFAKFRILAEQNARKKNLDSGIEETTLAEIYQALQNLLSLDETSREQLKKLELSVEQENIIGINENIYRVKQLCKQGKHVILISDMYIPSVYIKDMLIGIDQVFMDIPMYVSADYRYTKYSGKLFQIVRDKENIPYQAWQHFGDNHHSDVIVPRTLGIDAIHFSGGELWNIEKSYLASHYAYPVVQYAIGLARYLRLKHRRKSYPFLFGVTVAGFLLTSYVAWIVKQCRQRSIQRLYFIARDGYIPYLIMKYTIKKYGLSLHCKYIYGSRYAWRMSAFDGTATSLRRLILSYLPETLTSVAKILKLDKSVLLAYLPPHLSQNENIEFDALKIIVDTLGENSDFLQMLYTKQHSERDLVIAYLKQEIDTNDDRFAFVDVRGTGYTQECLGIIMRNFYPHPIDTFALYMGDFGKKEFCNFKNFFRQKCELIVESFFQSLEGSTIGYKIGSAIKPVLNKEGNALTKYGYKDYIRGCMAYTVHFMPALFSPISTDISMLVEEWKNEIIQHIYDKELCYIKDMPCEPTSAYLMLTNRNKVKISINSGRIVLYGAGKYGKMLYEELSEKKDVTLVAWLDKNYRQLQEKGYRVDGGLEFVNELSYDTFLIGIHDLNGSIHETIIKHGVPEEKIVNFI